MTRLFPILLLGCLVAGCTTQSSAPEMKTVRGVLKHFPSDVRSSQAWHGHNFMVGDTPVIPTEKVPESALKKFVGSPVIVRGIWHPGKRWNPTDENMTMPMPVYPDKQVIVRGDGLRLSSIGPWQCVRLDNMRKNAGD